MENELKIDTPKINPIETELSHEEEVAKFRQEIAAIKEQEAEKEARNEKYDPHFRDINPGELTELEADVYEKYKDGTLTFDEFNAARNEAAMEVSPRTLPENVIAGSRSTFYAFLGNKVNTNQWRKKWELE